MYLDINLFLNCFNLNDLYIIYLLNIFIYKCILIYYMNKLFLILCLLNLQIQIESFLKQKKIGIRNSIKRGAFTIDELVKIINNYAN